MRQAQGFEGCDIISHGLIGQLIYDIGKFDQAKGLHLSAEAVVNGKRIGTHREVAGGLAADDADAH